MCPLIKQKFLFLLLFLLIASFSFTACSDTESIIVPPEVPPAEMAVDFPALHLTSQYDPFTVERTFWHDGTLSVTSTVEEYAFTDAAVRIRGRGNSTWVQGADKRPLRLRFAEPIHLFDSDYAHRDWILLANHFDTSLMRNHMALHLASLLDGLDFTPSSRFVHLYVNEMYMGVYELTDERDVASGRAPLIFDADPTISEYFFELDGHLLGWQAADNVEGEDFFTIDDMAFDIRYPSSRDWSGHLEYLHDFVQNVHDTIYSRDFDAIAALIDLPSFIDFYLVQELTKNADVSAFSVFMTLRGQGEQRRIYFGPVWDFDRSSGNVLISPEPDYIFAAAQNTWFRELLEVPEIFTLVAARFNEIRDVQIADTIAHVRALAVQYEHSFDRNFDRHPNLLGQPHRPTPEKLWRIDSFMGHVDYLTAWLEARILWLDDFFNERPTTDTLWFDEPFDLFWALVLYHTYTRPIHIHIDDVPQQFSMAPIFIDSLIFLSAEEIGAAFDLTVSYDTQAQLLTIEGDNLLITHTATSNVFIVNDEEIASTPSSVIIREHVYIPLRILVDALGYSPTWEHGTRTTTINR